MRKENRTVSDGRRGATDPADRSSSWTSRVLLLRKARTIIGNNRKELRRATKDYQGLQRAAKGHESRAARLLARRQSERTIAAAVSGVQASPCIAGCKHRSVSDDE
ncbi:hypothetical protein HN011_007375 [Eciton burchellii]|nr:hypothetical protein HN011_007375 [Eciton burchellii]